MKLRPVLLLTTTVGPIPEVLVAYISSVVPAEPLPSDLLLDPAKPEFQKTHLKTSSALRLHKVATIHSSSIVRYLGEIDAATQKSVGSKLKTEAPTEAGCRKFKQGAELLNGPE
jgi:mRNA interferase MazF